MKKYLIQFVGILAVVCRARSQGTLQYDQQVSDLNSPGGYDNILPEPTYQSFVPGLGSVGFVQLYLEDSVFNGSGGTLVIDLWSGSVGTGTLVATSDPEVRAPNSIGLVQFNFSTPATVTAETTYYFEPIIQSGDSFEVGEAPGLGYANGNATFSGIASPADMWFREGIVVPEPASLILISLGASGVFLYRRKS